MVKIRLKRLGAKRKPFYRVVVADSRTPRNGSSIDEIGIYDPNCEPARIEINADKVNEWIANGAQPTETVARLFKVAGISK